MGHVAGRSQTSAAKYHAVRWSGGSATDLTPSSDYAVAYGANDIGQVVGSIDNWKGFLWENGTLTLLPDLGGGCSHAQDISDTSHIVGASCTPQVNQPHATLWHNGGVFDLGILPGMDDSGATAINSSGQIVGTSSHMDPDTYEITSKAFLYENGVMSAADADITINYTTANGSATSIDDYTAASGSLTFAVGQTSKTVSVAVNGDKKREAYETFYAHLSGGAGAFLADGQGVGEIRNDDR